MNLSSLHLYISILAISALINLSLLLFLFTERHRRTLKHLFYVVGLCLYWQIAEIINLTLLPPGLTSLINLLWRSVFFSNLLLAYFLLRFNLSILKLNLSTRIHRSLLIGLSLIFPIVTFTNQILENTTHRPWQSQFSPGPLFPLYLTCLLSLLIASAVSVITRSLKSSDTVRRRSQILLGYYFVISILIITSLLINLNHHLRYNPVEFFVSNLTWSLLLVTLYHFKLTPPYSHRLSLITKIGLGFLVLIIEFFLVLLYGLNFGLKSNQSLRDALTILKQGIPTPAVQTDIFQHLEQQLLYQEQLTTILSLACTLIVATILLNLFIVTQITLKPLSRLVNSIKQIAQGIYDTPIGSYSKDEIADLANSLNDLRLKLKDLTQNFNQKITSQTKQLSSQLAQEEKTTEAMLYLLERTKRINQELADGKTQLKRHQQELLQQQRQLEKANRKLKRLDVLKTDFLSNVNHELRTPLTSIRMYNQLLYEHDLGDINPRQEAALKTILDSTDHLITLVNQLLEARKLEEGRLEFNYSLCHIQTIVQKTLQNLKALIDQKQVNIITQIDNHIPPFNLDETRMIEVFSNLIDNAIKFNQNHQPITITAEAITKTGENICRIQVIDKGIGINTQDQTKLFNKFYQAQSAVTKTQQGTGLGLAICKQIIQAHQGLISVSSHPGQGTTFTIHLPMKLS